MVSRGREYNVSPSVLVRVHTSILWFFMGCPSRLVSG